MVDFIFHISFVISHLSLKRNRLDVHRSAENCTAGEAMMLRFYSTFAIAYELGHSFAMTNEK